MSAPHQARGRPLPAELAKSLQDDILAGRLEPGSKLPTEKELARSFGVSRSAVREAIAQLRSAQLLRTHHGLGTFVVLDPRRPPLFRLSGHGWTRLSYAISLNCE